MSISAAAGLARFGLSLFIVSSLSACSDGGISESQDAEQPVDDQPGIAVGNLGPAGTSGLTVGDARYPLDSAIGDVWGPDEHHFQIDFTFTNGDFKLESVVVEGRPYKLLTPSKASAVFFVQIFTPGSSFDYATYSTYAYTDEGGIKAPGVGYFTKAYVGIDKNHDGQVADNERFSVIDGTINFTGVAPDILLDLSVTLSDGQSVTGDYSGLLDYIER